VTGLLSDLLRRGQGSTKDSAAWFRKGAAELRKLEPLAAVKSVDRPFARVDRLSVDSIGKLYMFVYDPKTKKTMPYYDTFPMVIPIEFYRDGFLGVNLHYLPPKHRAVLLDALMGTANNDKMDKTTKMKVSYRLLKGFSRYRYFQPCVKRYLGAHVRSPFVYVAPLEWRNAIFLPAERFMKEDTGTVWRDSLNMLGSR
jgi:hypothetical protein